IIIEKNLLSDQIKELKNKMSSKPSVKIAGWVMNELNFEDIDKNAVKRLNFIQKRNMWKDNATLDEESASRPVRLENLNITFKIPEGWIEQELVNSEVRNGIVKYYRSDDGKSSIYIASVDPNGLNSKEISELWITKMGRIKIKERWGKKDNIEYLWTLSNSKKKDVMELYAMSYDNHTLLISGTTTKDKYNFFKCKIDSVFKSISPDV
ncbi:MAG: hypothetical protein MUC95_09580, partial [Spirochaetes bacterium]|nr:hypothetical protein [Spirochaetota bacterium]